MKKVKMKYFSLYSPRIERKGHLQEVYMKLFHKDEFHKYMRTLARQRIEDKLFFKEISKCIRYENTYKKEDIRKIMKGL